jgi:hypothetical protein
MGKFAPGHKFGEWTVTTGTVMGSPAKLNVKCMCGTERYVDAYTLVKGKSTSCGCNRTGENAPNWQGVNGLSKTAISRNLTHTFSGGGSINAVYAVNLYVSQTGSCGITGQTITSDTARLERSDPSQPYQNNNVLWVHNSVAPLVAEYGVVGTVAIANAVVSNASLSSDNMQGASHVYNKKARQEGHKKGNKKGKTSRSD